MVNIVTPEGSPEGSPIMSAMDYFYANQNHHDDDDYTTSENEMQLDDPVLEEIKQDLINTDINSLTPVEALLKLNNIKEKVNPKKSKK